LSEGFSTPPAATLAASPEGALLPQPASATPAMSAITAACRVKPFPRTLLIETNPA
jgi:hypothetical protein